MSIVNKYFAELLDPANTVVRELDFSGNADFSTTFTIHCPDLDETWLIKIIDDHLAVAEIVDVQSSKLGFVLDSEIFSAIISGSISVQKAFLSRKVNIKGNLFKGMMISRMLGIFFEKLAEQSEPAAAISTPQTVNEFSEELLKIKLEDGTSVNASMGYDDDCVPESVLFIFPPHPILGGDFDNNVVNLIYSAAVANGQLAVKFNYRLVDAETADSQAMLDYWRECEAQADYEQIIADTVKLIQTVMNNINRELVIEFAAYSFGCYIALQTMGQVTANNFIGISPPLLEYDFNQLFAKHPSLDFIIADNDEFCPEEQFTPLTDKYGIKLHTVAAADHFFRGCEARLKQTYITIMENNHAQ
ncbi:MAG: SCP2 sterol-binding domain-containing protein [Victivallaceae bacterium]|nr:SCP2 sterol-binding domain-containing protein [Victivallaceae bacterium]